MSAMPPSFKEDEDGNFPQAIVKKASECRLEAMKCTGNQQWALLAMAEELEELGHQLNAQEIPHRRPLRPPSSRS
jgi:hypothetical protein